MASGTPLHESTEHSYTSQRNAATHSNESNTFESRRALISVAHFPFNRLTARGAVQHTPILYSTYLIACSVAT